MGEQHRKKRKAFTLRLDEKIFDVLEQKSLATNLNKTKLLEKIILEGSVVKFETINISKLSNEINKIGVDINQIAHRINSHDGSVKREEFDLLEDKIWELRKTVYEAIWEGDRCYWLF